MYIVLFYQWPKVRPFFQLTHYMFIIYINIRPFLTHKMDVKAWTLDVTWRHYGTSCEWTIDFFRAILALLVPEFACHFVEECRPKSSYREIWPLLAQDIHWIAGTMNTSILSVRTAQPSDACAVDDLPCSLAQINRPLCEKGQLSLQVAVISHGRLFTMGRSGEWQL